MSRVFVVNCGSSSLKWSVVDDEVDSAVGRTVGSVSDHAAALDAVLASEPPLDGLVAVAHRVVHGGERFSAPVLINDAVLAAIRDLSVLAPLHNPVNADGIEVARRAFPDLPHVAVFDTAFHASLPPRAFTYAVPRAWGVRRYGFHGTSHAYVAREAARLLGREAIDCIVLHLGNGASATAVKAGRSIDTSMGLTPLEGLVMGTRSGDVDPALVAHVRRTRNLSDDEIDAVLNSRSGLLALAGDNDMREVHRRIATGDAAAELALDVYCYRIRKYVGAYMAALGGCDAIAFTAGVGENDPVVRARSLAGLERLGDRRRRGSRNAAGGPVISAAASAVTVLVVPDQRGARDGYAKPPRWWRWRTAASKGARSTSPPHAAVRRHPSTVSPMPKTKRAHKITTRPSHKHVRVEARRRDRPRRDATNADRARRDRAADALLHPARRRPHRAARAERHHLALPVQGRRDVLLRARRPGRVLGLRGPVGGGRRAGRRPARAVARPRRRDRRRRTP